MATENTTTNITDTETKRTKKPCPKNFKFTEEEQRVIRECKSESFWQRSVPISTALGVATYAGVNSGYLKANAKYGAAPKVLLAVVVGYFAGKLAYKQKCAEKFMALPNSQIGEWMRKRRDLGFWGPGFGPGMWCPFIGNPTCPKGEAKNAGQSGVETNTVQKEA